jgi:hypothetical protein
MLLSFLYPMLAGCLLFAAGSARYSPAHFNDMHGRGMNLPLTRVRRQKPQIYDTVSGDVSVTNIHEE